MRTGVLQVMRGNDLAHSWRTEQLGKCEAERKPDKANSNEAMAGGEHGVGDIRHYCGCFLYALQCDPVS